MTEADICYMKRALELAQEAADADEVPVGAVVVCRGEIVGEGSNCRESTRCATHHAEIVAIEEACRRMGGWRLPDSTLYVTLEPCPMCAGAIVNARVERVVFGAFDRRAGAFGSLLDLCALPLNHHPQVEGGVEEQACADLLRTYFQRKREK